MKRAVSRGDTGEMHETPETLTYVNSIFHTITWFGYKSAHHKVEMVRCKMLLFLFSCPKMTGRGSPQKPRAAQKARSALALSPEQRCVRVPEALGGLHPDQPGQRRMGTGGQQEASLGFMLLTWQSTTRWRVDAFGTQQKQMNLSFKNHE